MSEHAVHEPLFNLGYMAPTLTVEGLGVLTFFFFFFFFFFNTV